MDSDSDDEYCFVKQFKIDFETKAWDSAKINMKREGKWLVFLDGKTGAPLNEPPPISTEREAKKYYKRKTPKSPKKEEIKPFEPPPDNYNAFRPRKQFVLKHRPINENDRYKNIDFVDLSQIPKNGTDHYFIGDQRHKNPFRVSNHILNQKRMKEMNEILEEGYRKRAPKTSRRQLPSLFERSVNKPQKFVL